MLIQTSQQTPGFGRAARPAKLRSEEAVPSIPELVRDHLVLGSVALGPIGYVAGSAYPSTWLHEQGHALTAKALFANSRATVSVTPFAGGGTRWFPGELSPLGQKFGPETARTLVSAAGTLVDMGVAAGSFGLGFKLRKQHPILGAGLMGFAGMTVVSRIGYAAGALGGDLAGLAGKGHDFANLAVRAGLHPLASIALMASMLPLEYAALRWLEKQTSSTP